MPKIQPSYQYTNQNLLDLYRECLATISVRGKEYEINGVTFTSLDIDKVQKLIDDLETKITLGARGFAVNKIQFGGRG